MAQTKETALGEALKAAVQSISKKKQTEMIAGHLYTSYPVFKQFKPLAIGIHEALGAALPQYEAQLIGRVLSNHCRKPRYLKSVARGGKRFALDGKPAGVVSDEEKAAAHKQCEDLEARAQLAAQTAKPLAAKPAEDSTTDAAPPAAE
ncbi:ProQ/FINO family protein [Craterilacuibacter sinensis]|uniref:ProQ/FINO family protein n=1 Tax=Craterilacuibacter sinensis TaxID=2686017 RepID=A0A845BIP4_9NEIS|nr:ProQ/FINO family protein [Craterilacuibacter sinensis]MXR36155.1 ProQ/FINO family protein [Craterilacuibacter sinensis]RQW25505.1 ProQ/FINO family protein [Rhodobacteraceae bacterium CH30]